MLVYQAIEAEKIWFDIVNLSPNFLLEILNDTEKNFGLGIYKVIG